MRCDFSWGCFLAQAIEVTGVYDHQSNRALELALARHSWRLKVDKLLVGSSKPSLLQIQHCLTEVGFLLLLKAFSKMFICFKKVSFIV